MRKLILSAFMALLLLSGCKTKEVIRYVEIPKLTTKIDSVLIQRTDSFMQFQKGDTIFQSRWKTISKDRIKIQHDSISVPVEVKVEVPVKVEIIKYKRDWLFWIGIIALAYIILRTYFSIKNKLH